MGHGSVGIHGCRKWKLTEAREIELGFYPRDKGVMRIRIRYRGKRNLGFDQYQFKGFRMLRFWFGTNERDGVGVPESDSGFGLITGLRFATPKF